MKLLKGEDIVIYINKKYLKNIDLNDKEKLQNLIKRINQKYNVELYGYYNVIIYKDNNYGIIIEIKKEELDYMDYFNNELEMNIEINEDSFLYKIEDIHSIKNFLNKCIIRKQNENLYLELKNVSNIEMGIILENTIIVYGKETQKIRNKSKIIDMEVIL